ncbi:MAG: hypothetical protein B7Z35_03015 [Hydrogenophilales bacterium 12-61-10]|nr:MAG: hypothetical protein B7Z35_03015 [Hydrogenophilales bacterium 12-61-10]OYX29135.1 MAG: hypothetical protein B7Z03_09835 [Hydrogenophilales bacterium 32-62-9]
MLVTFTCKAYADITMFGDVAQSLLKMMGHSDTVPGAILAADVPAALENLKRAVDQIKAAPPQSASADPHADADEQQPVSLAHRALPLIELLTAAARDQVDVMWK